jgi:uncharacterized membrane protein YcaP (DUF421 family)
MEDLIAIAVRVSATYVYVLLILRLTGKRTFGQLSAPDALSAFIVGDMFDDIVWAEVPMSQGVVGISTIVLLHLVVEYGIYRSSLLDWLLEGKPTRLVTAGRLEPDGMRKEHLAEHEVLSQLRLHGVEDQREVEDGRLEPSGKLSAVKREEHRPARRSDLPKPRSLLHA